MSQSLPEPSHVIADKYVVERSLGQGGMGAVYLVSHRITGKKLALKCLLPQYLDYPELVERFTREAQAAGRIQHRHVVDVFDVGRDGSVLFIVMPYLEGKPLSLLLREQTLTLDEALAILLRAMEGVAAAHAQGIVHRDLKPDNIFVCVGPSGRLDDPRVLDFGISKLDDEEEKRSLTKSGVLMGTPHYMSFEQLNSQRDIDARADVYAMGCILYEAIGGALPYSAESAPALAIRMMSGPPKHLSALRPDLPEGLVNAVMKAIEKEREQRQASMAALIAELSPFVPQHVAGSTVEDAHSSRRLTRPDLVRRSLPGGEDATIAAHTPTAKHEMRSAPRDAASLARSQAHTVVTPEAPITQPRLRLGDEPERQRPAAASSDSRFVRLGAAAVTALALGSALVWGLAGSKAKPSPEPTPRASASAASHHEDTQLAPSEPSPGAAAVAEPDTTPQPKRRVVRKLRRKKTAHGAPVLSPPSGSVAPAAPGQPASAANNAAEEWEEYEEVVEVGDGDVGAAPDDGKASEVPSAPGSLPAAPLPADLAPAGKDAPATDKKPAEAAPPAAVTPAAAESAPAPAATP